MKVVRPIRVADLEPLLALAEQTTFGLTTLPRDRELLGERVRNSVQSFGSEVKKPGGENYLFVLEEGESGRILGTCGIASKVGGFEPFYAYRIETTVHESARLGVRKEVRMLHLEKEHSGPSEIGSLFLLPDSRRGGAGRLLSLSRFLFMAGMRGRFEKNVIAEMRGVIGRSGHSPFWEGLGKHFFETEFAHADYLSMKDKTFIAELMPVHPIYIDLLPAGAREVIGQVHPDTRPALGLLEGEGFEFTGRVDIFEGGPIVGCPLGDIRTVRESAVEIVSEVVSNPGEAGGPGDAPAGECILSNVRLDFRACLGAASPAVGEGVRIPRPVSEALQVEAGDRIRIAALRPPRPDEDRA